MLQALVRPDRHLSGQPFAVGEHRRTYHGWELGLNEGMAANHDKNAMPLRVVWRVRDAVKFSSLHGSYS
jgi:hypothetical protein